MGVSNLHQFLKKRGFTKEVHLQDSDDLKGKTAAMDIMSWLHKAIHTKLTPIQARALAEYQHRLSKGENPNLDSEAESAINAIVSLATNQLKTLRNKYEIQSICVIDGKSPPCKGNTAEERQADRTEAFLAEKYKEAITIDSAIKYYFIEECKRSDLTFIVAPYEADPQLAKLVQCGKADFVITEDSDLLAYGCPDILFKLKEGKADRVTLMSDFGSDKSSIFYKWSHEMFITMCLLSGCDYFPGVNRIGPAYAHNYVRLHKSLGPIIKVLKRENKIPRDFDEGPLWRAYETFLHQRVYNPITEEVEMLNPKEMGESEEDVHLGSPIDKTVAKRIAHGDIDPVVQIPLGDIHPELNRGVKRKSHDDVANTEDMMIATDTENDSIETIKGTNIFTFQSSFKL